MFKTVLVSVDVSLPEEARKILIAAKALTASWECDLHVVTVVPDVGMAIVGAYLDKRFEDQSHDAAEIELKTAMTEVGIDARAHVAAGTVYDRVIQLADTIGADLILISAHSPELKDYLLGSNAARIVRHSQKSVLVLRI
ncbi:MAG TPA: universal stress protein UspA [Rhodobacteraceae bacterium]|nr:universal stress protein UspA [Paracoccaceae bacterium]